MLPIFAGNPNNPGAAHYIIHAADTPELASVGLAAARKYASIAPDSPHAVHMPSHIFSRLGYWREVIESNERSAGVAAGWMASGRQGRFDEHHALVYLEYAYLQMGAEEKAREQIRRIHKLIEDPGGDAWAEVDARILFDAQCREWKDALLIQPPQGSAFKENFDFYWIQTIASAETGDIPLAKSSLSSLFESISQWTQGSSNDSLHLQLEQARAAVAALLGRSEEAVSILRDAVQFEQTHPVDYPSVLTPPSAERLGYLLLKLNRPEEALAAFQTALVLAPNTRNSIQGLNEAQQKATRN